MSTAIKEKTTYSMKEIKEKTGLSEDTLRYYERDGLLSTVARLPNGHRRYSQHNLDWLMFVLCLRSTGMPLKKIKRYKELMEQGDHTASERKQLLICQKEAILKDMETLKDALGRINWKIDYYDTLEKNL